MECQQIYQNAKILSSTRPDARSYLRFVPFSRSEILETIPIMLYYNFKELLTCYPRVEPARIGLYQESDFDCPGS